MAGAAPEIETPRLILRQWRDGDAGAFAAMNSDAQVMRHFESGPLSRAESDATLGQLRRKWRSPGFCYFAVEAKDGGFVGFVGLNRPMFEAHFTPCVEIAWRLVRVKDEAAAQAFREIELKVINKKKGVTRKRCPVGDAAMHKVNSAMIERQK